MNKRVKATYNLNEVFLKAALAMSWRKFNAVKAMLLVEALKGPMRAFDVTRATNRHITVIEARWRDLVAQGLMVKTSLPRRAVTLELTEKGRFEAQQLLARFRYELEREGKPIKPVKVDRSAFKNVPGTKSYRRTHPFPSTLKQRAKRSPRNEWVPYQPEQKVDQDQGADDDDEDSGDTAEGLR